MRRALSAMAAAAWTRCQLGSSVARGLATTSRPCATHVAVSGGGRSRGGPRSAPPPTKPPPRGRRLATATAAVDAGALTPGAFDPAVGGTLRVGLSDTAGGRAGAALPPTPPPAGAPAAAGRLRLDAFLSARCPGVSRARLAAAVRAGAVAVNGVPASRPGAPLKVGDTLTVAPLPPPPPLAAEPEALPSLDIVHEDGHVIVVNKAPGVVVHPAPGARTGTLVGGLLHHVRQEAQRAQQQRQLEGGGGGGGGGGARPAASAPANLGGHPPDAGLDDDDDADDEDEDGEGGRAYARPVSLLDAAAAAPPASPSASSTPSALRPGIVHRLDRGTSGLLVVAKTAAAHEALARDFASRAVRRVYVSLTLGVPNPAGGTVRTNVGRDPADRTRMAALPFGGNKGRPAVSDYRVVEVLAGGAAAVVEWRLRTGRTHQIRVHARHVGHPLLGDDTYGGGGSGAVGNLAARVVGKNGRKGGGAALAAARAQAGKALSALGGGGGGGGGPSGGVRPALHARSLGFTHPGSGEALDFEVEAPADFREALEALRRLGEE